MTSSLVEVSDDLGEDGGLVQRTALLGGHAVLVAQPGPERDQWVLGWRPRRGTRWQDVAQFAASHQRARYAGSVRVSVYVENDTQFRELPDAFGEVQTEFAFSFSGMNHYHIEPEPVVVPQSSRPEVILVQSDHAQVEVIFDPESHKPATLSLLASRDGIRHFASLVAAFHENDDLRNDRAMTGSLLERICTKNYIGEIGGDEGRQSMWREYRARG